MNLIINGQAHDLQSHTVTDVISHFKLKPNLIIVEMDGEIIDRDNWSETVLKEGSKIELVEFIAGG
ncbi:sulfur carrier protein ThiS [Salipaludibacillus sp. HK11]|uniref:sulfur carrier protein ThiS n=1 Tax=Salipaludibacillus sp. HK11 TaxID=3394320 RepID=UPI0039FCEB76